MTISGIPGESVTARVEGLTATSYRIVQADSPTTVVSGPTGTGITNVGTLDYKATVTLPGLPGEYEIQWDDGSGLWDATEEVLVSENLVSRSFRIATGPWPVGTLVSIYLDRDPTGHDGQPRGAVFQSQTVASDSSVVFTGLDTNARYIAAAQVAGVWQRVRFSTYGAAADVEPIPVDSTYVLAAGPFTSAQADALIETGQTLFELDGSGNVVAEWVKA